MDKPITDDTLVRITVRTTGFEATVERWADPVCVADFESFLELTPDDRIELRVSLVAEGKAEYRADNRTYVLRCALTGPDLAGLTVWSLAASGDSIRFLRHADTSAPLTPFDALQAAVCMARLGSPLALVVLRDGEPVWQVAPAPVAPINVQRTTSLINTMLQRPTPPVAA